LRIAGNRPIDIEHLPIKVGLRGRVTGLRRHVAGSDIFSLGRGAALPSSGEPFFDGLFDHMRHLAFVLDRSELCMFDELGTHNDEHLFLAGRGPWAP